jgi:hypothetical protein
VPHTPDLITISIPRAIVADISQFSSAFCDRMHELLEKNTDGKLTPVEKRELDALVRLAELAQIASTVLLA